MGLVGRVGWVGGKGGRDGIVYLRGEGEKCGELVWSSGLAVAHTRTNIYSDVCMYRRQLIVCSELVPVIAVSLLTGCIDLFSFLYLVKSKAYMLLIRCITSHRGMF